jgi:hypothetical protein
MKKKNVIGHMVAEKNAKQGFFYRWGILPRFFCLLLALLIWLLVTHVNHAKKPELPPGFGEAQTQSVTQ